MSNTEHCHRLDHHVRYAHVYSHCLRSSIFPMKCDARHDEEVESEINETQSSSLAVCENGKNFCMSHPSRALLSFFATLSMSSKIILCCSRTKLQRSTKYTTLFHHRALTFVWDFHYQILHIHKLAELIGANKRSEKEFHGSLSHMSRISTVHTESVPTPTSPVEHRKMCVRFTVSCPAALSALAFNTHLSHR